jgi:hypothetical protein
MGAQSPARRPPRECCGWGTGTPAHGPGRRHPPPGGPPGGRGDYFTKPFAQAELLARVQTLLARHAVRRQFAARPDDGPTEGAAGALAIPEMAAAETAAALAPPAAAGEQLAQW